MGILLVVLAQMFRSPIILHYEVIQRVEYDWSQRISQMKNSMRNQITAIQFYSLLLA